jgi:hypothetical protein
MIKSLRVLLVAGACLVASAGAVTAGAASTESTWMVCPDGQPVRTGQLDPVTFVGPVSDPHAFTATGTITPCAPPGQQLFAIAAYGPRGAATADGGLRRYDELAAGGTFTMRFKVASDTRALCLISTEDTRLDCVAVDWPSAGVAVVGGHLPTDSATVGMPAAVLTFRHGSPGCPTCIHR